MTKGKINCIGVFTSGGDAPGMNATVRAVIRTSLHFGVEAYAIYQGYQGMVEGGDMIKKMDWDSVSGILHKGGTIIGTARCKEFRKREGRIKAAKNLIEKNIDKLVVIGGDGSLTGANLFREEWPSLIAELVEKGEISKKSADEHPVLRIIGLVGSIDNDMTGTDMTIGADTATKRINDAIDMLASTAASHQRTFVVEVMGRNCGYLALVAALSTGADYVLIPENPPTSDTWEKEMCDSILASRKAGKRNSLIIVAEGAKDGNGNEISSEYVRQTLEEKIGEDARVTILGHVQRGGPPSAYDRYMSTVLGYTAVKHIIEQPDEQESKMIGMQDNKICAVSLMKSVEDTQSVVECIKNKDYKKAMKLRGGSFIEELETFNTLRQSFPHPPKDGKEQRTLLVINAGNPAPGMNIAVRTAVRLGLDNGLRVIGANLGIEGLINADFHEFNWMEVEEWTSLGGSELGTNRMVPENKHLYPIARALETEKVNAILIIGGITGYETAYKLFEKREEYNAFNIPIMCLPASISNNLPGTDFSLGSDSALNNIVEAVDKIKESAVASKRAFIVEVMGRYCGYLATMSGLATGAERVYTHESGVTLKTLMEDVNYFVRDFKGGKRLGLVIRNEFANEIYTTPFIAALYEEDGGEAFEVRQAILGNLQNGGNPSPFDRITATRLAAKAVEQLLADINANTNNCKAIGIERGKIGFKDLYDLPRLIDKKYRRPINQWWLDLKPIADVFAHEKEL